MRLTLPRTAATLAALLLTPLAGCAGSSERSSLRVDAPADCEPILTPVPFPPAVRKGDDLGVAVARRGAALKEANGRLDKGRTCVADQRKAYEAAR